MRSVGNEGKLAVCSSCERYGMLLPKPTENTANTDGNETKNTLREAPAPRKTSLRSRVCSFCFRWRPRSHAPFRVRFVGLSFLFVLTCTRIGLLSNLKQLVDSGMWNPLNLWMLVVGWRRIVGYSSFDAPGFPAMVVSWDFMYFKRE
jgi:hypothetical protein